MDPGGKLEPGGAGGRAGLLDVVLWDANARENARAQVRQLLGRAIPAVDEAPLIIRGERELPEGGWAL
jgi:hypothetical protein